MRKGLALVAVKSDGLFVCAYVKQFGKPKTALQISFAKLCFGKEKRREAGNFAAFLAVSKN